MAPRFSLKHRATDFLIAWRWPLLIVAVVLAAVAYRASRELAFDQSIENMFAEEDPLLPPFRLLKRTFGGDEIVLAAYHDENVLTEAGLRRLAEVRTRLKQTPGVMDVLTLADEPIASAIRGDDDLAKEFLELFEGYTIGADRSTTAAVCMLSPQENAPVPRAETIAQLRAIIQEQPQGTLAGEPVMVVDGFRYVEEDGRLLGWTSTVLLIAVIVFCFRSIRWVIVPIAVVQWAIVLTRATLVWSGIRLSMVSSMLTAVVTIVGVATVVHIIVRFREVRETGLTPVEALRQTGYSLFWPIIGAILTDVVGFGSLLVARVGPIQDFGAMMAIGSLLALVSVPLLIPGLSLIGRIDADPKRTWGEQALDRGLYSSVHWVQTRPLLLTGVTLLVAGLAGLGCLWLKVESDFTKNFRAKSPVVQSYEFVEENLGGAGVWNVIVPAPATLDRPFLDKIKRLEERLRSEVVLQGEGGQQPGLTKVISLADVLNITLDRLPRLPVFGGFMTEERQRAADAALLKTGLDTMRRQMPTFFAALYGVDPASGQPGQPYYRIMLRSIERQPSERKQELIAQVTRIAHEEFPQAEVTGFFVLLTNIIDSLLADQWLAFLVSTAGIGLMMLIAFRSPVLTGIALVPNLLPVFVVTGLMGWLGLKINMGAAMIAAVSMGLSIDSSIHYLTAFRHGRKEGLSVRETLDRVQQSEGRAMVFSTLALIVGFSALCISQFIPTVYFGALVILTMLGGLAGNLLLLPLLVSLIYRDPRPGPVPTGPKAAEAS